MSGDGETYPGGAKAVIARWNTRRAPLSFSPTEALPPLDADLTALAARVVPEDAAAKDPGAPGKKSAFAIKCRQIAPEFIGNSELAFLNAKLIATLRKHDWPDQAPALFRRLWAEEHAHLLGALNMRWKVSSVMTFADHGETEAQRMVGQSLTMLFGCMKLYESERLLSGQPPRKPFPQGRRLEAPLPLDMEPYGIANGGLDVNLLAPVWQMAQGDPGIAPLALHLLDALNADPGTVFRRFAVLRERRAARQAARGDD